MPDPSIPAPTGLTLRGLRVHFIGIGGCGMSGLARIVLDSGAIVTGTDSKPNEQTLDLASRGVRITYDQKGELLDAGVGLVVRTAAVKDDNPEYRRAAELGLPRIKYAEMLGRVMAGRFGVAVAGTHGKTTTTGMLAFALSECQLDPSFVIGGHVPQFNGSSRSGSGSQFVVEACEYDRSFHQLVPRVALVTNIEAEHLDVYKDLDDIVDAFATFTACVPRDGLVIACGSDPGNRLLLRRVDRPVQTYGIGEGFDWSIEPTETHRGCHHGTIRFKDQVVATLRPSLAGRHNLLNATAALAAAVACGANPASAADGVSRFLGAERRMTELGRLNGAIIVDDYGHHPTEIRATLKALREKYQPLRLICVFQPHQYNRTRHLIDDFAESFDLADRTIVPEIYAVRDSAEDRAAVSSADLAARITRRGNPAESAPTFDDVVLRLRSEVREGDLVVTMGAGNVYQIGKELVA
jgi:UDP-N-acetylmuramate--alanine ligase